LPTTLVIASPGKSLAGLRPDQITALGIARTFQNIRLFPQLSVFDNVRVACLVDDRPPSSPFNRARIDAREPMRGVCIIYNSRNTL
jgi:ABC-type branched-subunit amino acid transport system ATPase component